jgi:nitrate reductase cytochrome c-type subunit
MTRLVRIVVQAAIVQMLILPSLAVADDEVPSAKEVMQSEGMPPLIPHAMPKPGKNGQLACLSCHEEGKNGAPPTPHPERRMCTQCHIQGDIKGAKHPAKKK